MCIFLSGPHLKKIVNDLLLHYPPDTPVTLVYRATWPEQRIYQGSLRKDDTIYNVRSGKKVKVDILTEERTGGARSTVPATGSMTTSLA